MDADSEAFAALFHAHYAAVCRYIAARAEPDVVADIAGETFLVAWRRRSELPAEPRAWVLGTAGKCLANHRRSAMRRQRVQERVAALPAPLSPSVEDALTQAQQGRALLVALTSLGDHDRELLLLHHWDGLAAREIADVLGCSRVVARARLHRAGRRLQEALDSALRAEALCPASIEFKPSTWLRGNPP
jgi:RNA polymerase sigma-70 factor (ECF subfamily)